MSGTGKPSNTGSTKMRHRDRFKALWSSSNASTTTTGSLTTSTTPAVPAVVTSVPTPAAPVLANVPAGNNTLKRALELLTPQERITLEKHTSSTSRDVESTLKQALVAARSQQELCTQKRWRFTLAGKEIVLREQADKVAQWISKVKTIGNAAASIDPVHAGLPWAGLKVLLEATLADAKQAAALLVGCDTALYMSDRLSVYMEYSHDLPQCQAQLNLIDTLVEFYARILSFLAHAISTYQMNTMRRSFGAFWDSDAITDFETQCDKLRSKAHEDATACNLWLQAQDRKSQTTYRDKIDDLLQELKQLNVVQDEVRNLGIKLDLSKLPYAEGAMFNSYGESLSECHPDTRVELLLQIQTWAQDPAGNMMFWLQGKAGTGKSTVSRTISGWLDTRELLGASYLFKSGGGDRASGRKFFPTIVRQLIEKLPRLMKPISEVIDSSPLVFDKSIAEQFDSLLYKPLKQLKDSLIIDHPLVVVVDALDECENEQDIRMILTLWSRLADVTSTSLRLFITSRPEFVVQKGFKALEDDTHLDVDLHSISDTVTRNDITVFLEDEFRRIREEYNQHLLDDPLDRNWPDCQQLQMIVDMAHPLFIVAATVTRFVGNFDPGEQLNLILKEKDYGSMSNMDRMYQSIIEAALVKVSSQYGKRDMQQEFLYVVGSIVTLAEPLSRAALSNLLGLSQASIALYTRSLNSVLWVPQSADLLIRPIHLSFVEYFQSYMLRAPTPETRSLNLHEVVLEKCLKLMSGPGGLREDICDSKYPGPLHERSPKIDATQQTPLALQYASRYWMFHLQRSSSSLRDDGDVHNFLQIHALHWIEIMGLIRMLGEAITSISRVQSLIVNYDAPRLTAFLHDLYRFVLANRHIGEVAPLQLYSAAIVFAPQNSLVRNACGSVPHWIRKVPDTSSASGADILKFEGHVSSIVAVALSPNKPLLASISYGGSIMIWNLDTGMMTESIGTKELIKVMDGNSGMWNVWSAECISFSRDGKSIIIVLHTKVIIWNLATHTIDRAIEITPIDQVNALLTQEHQIIAMVPESGQEVVLLDLSTDAMKSIPAANAKQVALSSRYIAIAFPHMIELRYLQDPTQVKCATRHSVSTAVTAMALSFDDQSLVFGHRSGEVVFWDLNTEDEYHVLTGHSNRVNMLAFSNDNTRLASASLDSTVIIWDMKEKAQKYRLRGHSDSVSSVAFSPNSNDSLASAGNDRTVRIWDLNLLCETEDSTKPTESISTIGLVPHDQSLVVLGSDRGLLSLWKLPSKADKVCKPLHIRNFERQKGGIRSIVFSYSHPSLMATADSGGGISLWDLAEDTAIGSKVVSGGTGISFLPRQSHVIATLSRFDKVTSLNMSDTCQLLEDAVLLQADLGFSGAEAIAFSPIDDNVLAVSSLSRDMRLFDMTSGAVIQRIEWSSLGGFQFSATGHSLTSNAGSVLTLGERDASGVYEYSIDYSGVRVKWDWIVKNGQKLLWLPPEFRRHKNRVMVRPETGTIVIGLDSQHLCVIEIDPAFQGY